MKSLKDDLAGFRAVLYAVLAYILGVAVFVATLLLWRLPEVLQPWMQ